MNKDLQRDISRALNFLEPILIDVEVDEDLLKLTVVSHLFHDMNMSDRMHKVLEALDDKEEIAGKYTILVLAWTEEEYESLEVN